jgi:DNA mismatch repair protein MutL
VKHALAQFSITPTLDFELDATIQQLDAVSKPISEAQRDATTSSHLFKTFTQKGQAHFIEKSSDLRHWKDFYEPASEKDTSTIEAVVSKPNLHHGYKAVQVLLQIHLCYIVMQTEEGYLLIHQQNAHERVLYEKYTQALKGKPIATQQSLFPTTITISASDAMMLNELLPDMQDLGYQIEVFGRDTFVIQGTPADVQVGNEKAAIEKIMEQYKHFSSDLKFTKREKLLRSLAIQNAIKAGVSLTQKEMEGLIRDLFECEISSATATGRPTYIRFEKGELDGMFGR